MLLYYLSFSSPNLIWILIYLSAIGQSWHLCGAIIEYRRTECRVHVANNMTLPCSGQTR